jgi:alkyl hydroperoxide reductase subunit F
MFTLEAQAEVEGIVDVCIIGGGPAGMTAAVYLARKRLSTAIVTREMGGQVAWTLGIENYMGYQYITGRELTAKFEEQVRQFPVPIVMDEVKGIRRGQEGFTVVTSGGREISSRAVIVASGKRPKELGVPNEKSFIGRGLSYCATCDGPLFAKMDVAVCGGGNSALQAAIEMAQVASKVYLVSRSPWRADAIIQEKIGQHQNIEKKVGYVVVDVLGERTVDGLRIRDRGTGKEEVLKVKGVFVEIGLTPNTDFVKDLLKLNQYGEIEVNCQCETSVPGVFAAGDVTDVHEKQIVVAAGEGAKAALSAHEYLLRMPGTIRTGPGTW